MPTAQYQSLPCKTNKKLLSVFTVHIFGRYFSPIRSHLVSACNIPIACYDSSIRMFLVFGRSINTIKSKPIVKIN